MLTSTQEEQMENVYRSIRKMQKELKLQPRDNTFIDLMLHLEDNVKTLHLNLNSTGNKNE